MFTRFSIRPWHPYRVGDQRCIANFGAAPENWETQEPRLPASTCPSLTSCNSGTPPFESPAATAVFRVAATSSNERLASNGLLLPSTMKYSWPAEDVMSTRNE